MPEWADEGEPPHRGPVTAADIEAERQRMQKQWKAQREERQRAAHGEGGGEEEEEERGRLAERGPAHRRDHQVGGRGARADGWCGRADGWCGRAGGGYREHMVWWVSSWVVPGSSSWGKHREHMQCM